METIENIEIAKKIIENAIKNAPQHKEIFDYLTDKIDGNDIFIEYEYLLNYLESVGVDMTDIGLDKIERYNNIIRNIFSFLIRFPYRITSNFNLTFYNTDKSSRSETERALVSTSTDKIFRLKLFFEKEGIVYMYQCKEENSLNNVYKLIDKYRTRKIVSVNNKMNLYKHCDLNNCIDPISIENVTNERYKIEYNHNQTGNYRTFKEDKIDTVILTKHSIERKDRIRENVDLDRVANSALIYGEKYNKLTGSLKFFIRDKAEKYNHDPSNYRIFKGIVYVFNENVLITEYSLPEWIIEKMKKENNPYLYQLKIFK